MTLIWREPPLGVQLNLITWFRQTNTGQGYAGPDSSVKFGGGGTHMMGDGRKGLNWCSCMILRSQQRWRSNWAVASEELSLKSGQNSCFKGRTLAKEGGEVEEWDVKGLNRGGSGVDCGLFIQAVMLR